MCCRCCAQSLNCVHLQPHGLLPTRLLCPWGFSKREYWNGLPCLPAWNLPYPGIKPRSPALQADSLPAEPPEKPKSPGVGSLSLLQGIFLTQESKQCLLHCRQILYQLRYQGSPSRHGVLVKTLCTGQQVCSSMELPPLPVISLPHVNKKHNTCQNSCLKY